MRPSPGRLCHLGITERLAKPYCPSLLPCLFKALRSDECCHLVTGTQSRISPVNQIICSTSQNSRELSIYLNALRCENSTVHHTSGELAQNRLEMTRQPNSSCSYMLQRTFLEHTVFVLWDIRCLIKLQSWKGFCGKHQPTHFMDNKLRNREVKLLAEGHIISRQS